MYIFVDESGGFQIPPRPNQVSCVAALLVPESLILTLFRRFRRLTRSLRPGSLEVKGSQLSEHEMAQIIRTIRRFEVLLLVVAIDVGIHTNAGIARHKQEQAEKIRASSFELKPKMRDWVENLATRISALSNQLYVQTVLMTNLVQAVMEAGTLYYVQRIPKALGKFSWRVDAKDLMPTRYENLWREIVGPILQTMSLLSPLDQLQGADYSAFDRFCGEAPETPEHLRSRAGDQQGPFGYVDMKAFLADLKSCQSHRSQGIQIADTLASAVRRACNGTLQNAGWKELGRLMPAPRRGRNCVRFLALEDSRPSEFPYDRVVEVWSRDVRRMMVRTASV